MCFALFMLMLDNTVVNVALPSIQRDLPDVPVRRRRVRALQPGRPKMSPSRPPVTISTANVSV